MNFSGDRLVEILSLKKSLLFWKSISVIILLGSLLIFLYTSKVTTKVMPTSNYIGRLTINGFISENLERDRRILELRNDPFLKGLIIHINSPGGTVTGGESLYNALNTVAKSKPTVIVMDGLAASGGYMVSMAGEHIIAHHGTITGSIGVLLQSPDLSEISKKYGVGFTILRSGELKALPSMFEKLSDAGRKSLQDSLNVAYDYFLSLVLEKRKISDPNVVKLISTGKIFIGKQALESGLIDQIGDEGTAIEWLEKNKNVSYKVRDIKMNSSKSIFPSSVGRSDWKKAIISHYLENQGLLAVLPNYLGEQYLLASNLNE